MRCEGIVPEETRTTHSEMIEQEDGTWERVIHTETTPEHPCEAEAIMLARDMREVAAGEYEAGDEHVWCRLHYIPGRFEHADGTVTEHAYTSPDEYRGNA